MDFPLHDPDTAPEASRPLLEGAEQAYGFIPNLFRVMAESPSALQSYLAIGQALEQSALSPIEQQVAFLAVSGENGCDYCVGAHAAIAGMVEMPAAVLEALRARQPLPDERLEALRLTALALMEKRGWLDDADLERFTAAGYDRRALLDLITILAMKTLSNYVNHLAGTPLDAQFGGPGRQADAG